ncbi:MAG: translation elongation factor Ts [Holosporales bacterium]|jgi:elongation factor Ts|nr:translation elongation factor Ts [Holosporales bacterium]
MEIPAGLVKELRDKTGAGMMNCKRALIEANGDVVAAFEYLRKKGLMDTVRKSFRIAADGLIACSTSANRKTASIVEINSETDFVARNEKFQEVASEVAKTALEYDFIDQILKSKFQGSDRTIYEEINLLASVIDENISLRRCKRISAKNGIISTYIHGAIKPGMGKIGVLIGIESNGEFCSNTADELGKKIAMHVAAASPTYLSSEYIPQSVIAKEKEIVIAQAKDNGKPDDIAEKMAEGRVKKFLEENVLLNQIFVIDGKTKIGDFVANFNKERGTKFSISTFEKLVLGESIEKLESNFAEEVKSFIA